MSLYITLNGQNIVGVGKTGEVEINFWPQIDGQPARKNQCYWDGQRVQLKTQEMVEKEKAQKELESTDHEIETRGIDNLIDVLISKNLITENDLPSELKNKYNERKLLRNKL